MRFCIVCRFYKFFFFAILFFVHSFVYRVRLDISVCFNRLKRDAVSNYYFNIFFIEMSRKKIFFMLLIITFNYCSTFLIIVINYTSLSFFFLLS